MRRAHGPREIPAGEAREFDVVHPDRLEMLLVVLDEAADVERAVRLPPRIAQHGRVHAEAERSLDVEEEESVSAEQVADVVPAGREQQVDAELGEVVVELGGVEAQGGRHVRGL